MSGSGSGSTSGSTTGSGSNHGQTIGQTNSISATNSGDSGIADASGNQQSNGAINSAPSQGTASQSTGSSWIAGLYHAHFQVPQSINQLNSIGASNSGVGGIVVADSNNQSNIGINSR